MRKPTIRLGLATLVLGAMAPALLGQQAPPPPPRPQEVPRDGRNMSPPPTGTGIVSGAVVMAGTGQPARKVRVNLSGAELRGARSTTTDDQGRFSFTALPAGRFTLSANKPGHLAVTYGQRRPGTQGTPIQLSDGQKFAAQLEIPRGSVLTGTVLDENGEATPNTPVRAMRFVRQGTGRTLQSSGGGSTDDRGIYRIFGLQPGDYVVCATPRNTGIAIADGMRMEMESLQQTLQSGARTTEIDARVIQERLAAVQATIAQQGQEETPSGYAQVCYPGTTTIASATAVPLGVGEERPGIDFQLQLVPMARIEGTVVNSTGTQIQGLQVMLLDATQNAQGMQMGPNTSARPDGEGRFRLNGVAPGQYRLTARAQIGAGGQRGRGVQEMAVDATGRGGNMARPEPTTVWGAVDVVVDGRNVSNVMVPLQNGMAVSGHIAFEGSIPPPADVTRMRVSITSAEPGPLASNGNGRIDAGGRFTVPGLAPGRYRVSASGAPGWFMESAAVGGQDALDFPFEVKGGQNVSNIAITMTDRLSEISGVVMDNRNQPAVDYTLVVFPADSRYWQGAGRRFQTLRPGTDGRYTSRNLPPGEYKIAAVLDMEAGAGTDPAFLQQIDSSAERVTLMAGDKKVQDIRVR